MMMKKTLLSLVFAALSSTAMADTVRLSDGNSCSFDADDTPWELSLEGKNIHKGDDGFGKHNDSKYFRSKFDENHVGVKLSYSFGGPERLDCSKLYNMQLRTKEAELKLLEQQIELLQSNASIDWSDDLG